MKKTVLNLVIFLVTLPVSNAQTWTKISGIMDSSQIKGVAQIGNKILIAGQNWNNNTVTDYASSTDGNSWTSLPTYSFAGFLPNALPQNNLLLCSNGFTSTQKLNGSTWQLFSGSNKFAEFENGEIIGTMGSFPDTIYHFSNTGVKGAKLGNYTFKFSSKYCAASNNRVFVFAYGVGLGYIDYSNLGMIHIPATLDGTIMTQALWDMKFITDMKKTSDGTLFAIGDGLMKSTDNGENWTSVFFLKGTSLSSIAINTADEIYIIEGASDVHKSINMGTSFTNISGNLPTSSQSAFKTQLFTNENNELFITLNRNGGSFGGANSGIYKLTNSASIKDLKKLNFSFFPNPASENFTITLPDGDLNCRLVLTNTSGTVVYSKDNLEHSTQLNSADLASGIYFITISSENSTNTQKIIIQ